MKLIYKNKAELFKGIIGRDEAVLDIGFWGQGVTVKEEHWPHRILKSLAREVYGLDMDFDPKEVDPVEHYQRGSAEDFQFNVKFDKIFAGDLIEHLSNPGLFLQSCGKNLKKDDGQIILTTPNCFNLFNLAEKISKTEPTVNKDHTCYFNQKTLKQLLAKNGWDIVYVGFLHSREAQYRESWKKKVLNVIYYFLSLFTPKFMRTLVVIASRNGAQEPR